jgi:hypothetical protein
LHVTRKKLGNGQEVLSLGKNSGTGEKLCNWVRTWKCARRFVCNWVETSCLWRLEPTCELAADERPGAVGHVNRQLGPIL